MSRDYHEFGSRIWRLQSSIDGSALWVVLVGPLTWRDILFASNEWPHTRLSDINRWVCDNTTFPGAQIVVHR